MWLLVSFTITVDKCKQFLIEYNNSKRSKVPTPVPIKRIWLRQISKWSLSTTELALAHTLLCSFPTPRLTDNGCKIASREILNSCLMINFTSQEIPLSLALYTTAFSLSPAITWSVAILVTQQDWLHCYNLARTDLPCQQNSASRETRSLSAAPLLVSVLTTRDI